MHRYESVCRVVIAFLLVAPGLVTLDATRSLAHPDDGDGQGPAGVWDVLSLATVDVAVTANGQPLSAAVVSLDVNGNGVWEPELAEPQATTDATGTVVFNDIVSIGDDGHPVADAGWRPLRILTGNLRGTAGATEVHVDFVLPSGVDQASLALFDVRGRRLAGVRSADDLSLSVPAGLPAGVYFLRLSADEADAVAHRFTSVGQRTRTVTARRVSAAEAMAAGWAGIDPGAATPAKQRSDEPHRINLLVDHDHYLTVSQAEVLVPDLNQFTVTMPDVPTVGLQLWLDAADATTFDLGDADDVIEWRDRSGNDRHAVAVAASDGNDRKAIRTAGPNGTVVQFDQSRRSALLVGDFRPLGDFTVFCVVHSTHSASNQSYWWGGASSSEGGAFTLLAAGDRYVFSTYNRSVYSTEASKNSVNPQLVVLARGADPVANTVNIRIDGGADASGTVVGGASNPSFYLGCRGGSWNTEFPLNGFIAEHLHYDRLLTPEEIALVEEYLLARWPFGDR